MDCMKCGDKHEEEDIDTSHDIPKYMGGTDRDGRHMLCKKCHNKYDLRIFAIASGYIKNLSPNIKESLRKIALKVKEDFFKK